MKLTKTTQKLENNICKALTIVCEDKLHEVEGFCWLTHRVNYTDFPGSLVVTCVFDTEESIEKMKQAQLDDSFKKSIQKQLLKIGVTLKNMNRNIHFDSEEACQKSHAGQWERKLALSTTKQKPMRGNRTRH